MILLTGTLASEWGPDHCHFSSGDNRGRDKPGFKAKASASILKCVIGN